MDWITFPTMPLFFWRILMAGAYHNADATVAAKRAVAVTASDATIIPVTRSLYIGTSGTVVVRMAGDGVNATFTNVPVGVFPVQVDQVLSTGTTASGILALY
jgi:hypothetical protein